LAYISRLRGEGSDGLWPKSTIKQLRPNWVGLILLGFDSILKGDFHDFQAFIDLVCD
jgi:hypothetical protein